jgi:hypothetical protein
MQLIKINPENYVVVSDEPIEVGDYVLSKLNEVVIFGEKYTPNLYKKITHSTDVNFNEVYYIKLCDVKSLTELKNTWEVEFINGEIKLK